MNNEKAKKVQDKSLLSIVVRIRNSNFLIKHSCTIYGANNLKQEIVIGGTYSFQQAHTP